MRDQNYFAALAALSMCGCIPEINLSECLQFCRDELTTCQQRVSPYSATRDLEIAQCIDTAFDCVIVCIETAEKEL